MVEWLARQEMRIILNLHSYLTDVAIGRSLTTNEQNFKDACEAEITTRITEIITS